MQVHLGGTAIQLVPLTWPFFFFFSFLTLSFQVSPTSEVKTDSGTFQTTELEPRPCIQSNASAATTEDWRWRKGWLQPLMISSNWSNVTKFFLFLSKTDNLPRLCLSDGNGHWARSTAKAITGRYQHQPCSTGRRVQRLHGVPLPARPARFLPTCTTRQPWTNHLPSLRNQERSLNDRKKRLK